MSTQTFKKCPHCETVYESYTTYTKQYQNHTGSPFRRCSSCGCEFVDKDYKEPAFDDEPKKINLFQILLAPMFPFGLAGFGFAILSVCISEPGMLWIAALPLLGYFYLVYTGVTKRNAIDASDRAAYNQSLKRVSDRNYIIRLLDCGYKVPSWFLSKKFPDLVGYSPKKSK
jgi:hypothetical protein